MLIFVSGPYTKGDVAKNVRTAIEVGNNLRALGHTPFIPHLTHFWHLLIPHEIDYWYTYDIEWLLKCDAVFRIEGESNGADTEVEIAMINGMPVFTSYLDVPKERNYEEESQVEG